MIIYESLKKEFLEDVMEDKIADKVEEKYTQATCRHVSQSEKRAWNNSMQYMYKVLSDKMIPDDSGIAIEFKIPYISRRVDFIISGKNEENISQAIIIELKQWEKCEKTNKDAIVETFLGGGIHETTHPSYQAWSYVTTIQDFCESVQNENIELHPCAYLHNYVDVEPKTLLSDNYKEWLIKSPAFIKGDIKKLQEFITKFIKYGDKREAIIKIDSGKIRPSKSLQECLSKMLVGNKEFVMIDSQKVVYETALLMARKSKKDGKKRTLVIEGGPGTGKSVIAINLLVDLINEDMFSVYVTKNSAPRNVYEAKLSKTLKKGRISNLFKGSGVFVDEVKDRYDAIIVDEAHRLNAKSGMFKNKGENQIKEIINASKFSIFFIDENQKIDMYDIGTVGEILKYIKLLNAEYKIMKLDSQFRCNGSDGYLAFIDDILGIKETANNDMKDIDYDIEIFDDPKQVRERIVEKNKINNKSRMLAGYCYDWVSKRNHNSDLYDIVIDKHNFKMKWNFGDTSTWAIDKDSVEQVGCIHTSQGLEFDYVGVIIGHDMRCENGKIITDFFKRAKTDNSIKGLKGLYKKDSIKALKIADEIIKNTYRTLLTRGQKGCYVYCADKSLSDYLKMRIGQNKRNFVNKL